MVSTLFVSKPSATARLQEAYFQPAKSMGPRLSHVRGGIIIGHVLYILNEDVRLGLTVTGILGRLEA